MMAFTLRNKTYRFSAIQLVMVIGFGLLLSGCLVDDDDIPELKQINGNFNLRTIQDQDRLEYRISGTRTVGVTPMSVSGSLTVTYRITSIPGPYSSGSITVIEETSQLVLDDGTDVTSLRFLQQDANGALTLLAFNNRLDPDYVTTSTVTPSSPSDLIPTEIFTSPVPSSGTDTFNYYVWDNCVSSCNPLMIQIIEEIEYFGTRTIITDVGRYETLLSTSTGDTIISTTIASPLDFRMGCDANGMEFFTEFYVHPAVGVVEYFNSCSDSSGNAGHSIRITLRNTSFPLP